MQEIFRLIDETKMQHSTYSSRIIVVDDFYSDPDLVRKTVLEADGWVDFIGRSEGKAGRILTDNFFCDELAVGVCDIFGEEVVIDGNNNFFRATFAQGTAPVHVHRDSTYNVLVYLNPMEQRQGGTMFLSPKDPQMGLKDQYEAKYDINQWNVDAVIPLKYNRCIIFDAMIPHSRVNTFGDCLDNARLIQQMWICQIGTTNLVDVNNDVIEKYLKNNSVLTSGLSGSQIKEIEGVFGKPE